MVGGGIYRCTFEREDGVRVLDVVGSDDLLGGLVGALAEVVLAFEDALELVDDLLGLDTVHAAAWEWEESWAGQDRADGRERRNDAGGLHCEMGLDRFDRLTRD